MGAVDASPHHSLGVGVLHLLIIVVRIVVVLPGPLHARRRDGNGNVSVITAAVVAVVADTIFAGTTQRLAPPMRAPRRKRHLAVQPSVDLGWRIILGVCPLSAITDHVVVSIARLAVVGLALPPGGAEEAFFALAPAADARRVVGVVDAAEVASDFPASARDARLVDTLMLLLCAAGGPSCPSGLERVDGLRVRLVTDGRARVCGGGAAGTTELGHGRGKGFGLTETSRDALFTICRGAGEGLEDFGLRRLGEVGHEQNPSGADFKRLFGRVY